MSPILQRAQDLILPIGLIGSLLVILVPLPPMMMDVLLAMNVTISVIVLLTTIYVGTPMESLTVPLDAAANAVKNSRLLLARGHGRFCTLVTKVYSSFQRNRTM